MTTNTKLDNVTRTLQQLLRTLPAIRDRGNRDLLQRQLQLIAYFQARYDELVDMQPQAV